MKDRMKASINNSIRESISLNGELKSKIDLVEVDTRRTRGNRKLNIKNQIKKTKTQLIRDTCIDNSVRKITLWFKHLTWNKENTIKIKI